MDTIKNMLGGLGIALGLFAQCMISSAELPSVNDVISSVEHTVVHITMPNQDAGSGVIISEDGYIITNKHVTQGMTDMVVYTSDGVAHKGVLIGESAFMDCAVVKITGQFQAARLGSVAKLRTGDWVLAIGAPFGLEQTKTLGIISAFRDMPDPTSNLSSKVIQHDAALNPGNSGGPLFDLNGKLVGINVGIIAPAGAWCGISISLPIDQVMTEVDIVIMASMMK